MPTDPALRPHSMDKETEAPESEVTLARHGGVEGVGSRQLFQRLQATSVPPWSLSECWRTTVGLWTARSCSLVPTCGSVSQSDPREEETSRFGPRPLGIRLECQIFVRGAGRNSEVRPLPYLPLSVHQAQSGLSPRQAFTATFRSSSTLAHRPLLKLLRRASLLVGLLSGLLPRDGVLASPAGPQDVSWSLSHLS